MYLHFVHLSSNKLILPQFYEDRYLKKKKLKATVNNTVFILNNIV